MRVTTILLLLAAFATACGGPPERGVDTDNIRQNANDADRSLDRESSKYKD